MLRLNTDELLPRLTKSFASIKIVSATHARTGHEPQATSHGPRDKAEYSQSGLCVLTAKLALLIFLRCQFMVIFYVPNIKTQKATLHSPFPLSHPFALCHRIPTQSNSIRVSQVKSSFVFGYSAFTFVRLSTQFSSASDPNWAPYHSAQSELALSAAVQRNSESLRVKECAMLSLRSAHSLPTYILREFCQKPASSYSLVLANVLNIFSDFQTWQVFEEHFMR